ncbi:MAG: MBL fold metallo-hydrolase [Candidatus Aminicenantes bacterium]|nr:MBL fold metallo-hydrolase [Candidatus Aminicenantes bacterium]
MAELIFLGTSGATATATRDNTSFLLKVEKERLLIDCPGSIISKIKRVGEDPTQICTLFLTHTHPDHIYGLPSLVHSLMLVEKNLCIYGSPETVSLVAQLLDLFKLRQPNIRYQTTLISINSGEEKKISDTLRVKALSTPHHSSSLAYLFSLESIGQKWLFSGDTPPYPPLFEEAREVDLLVHEASAPQRFFEAYPELKTVHTSSFELGYLASRAGVKRLIPCHFFGEVDFSLEEIEAEIRANYLGELFIPQDLDFWPKNKRKF